MLSVKQSDEIIAILEKIFPGVINNLRINIKIIGFGRSRRFGST
jgi:hypothetical protein